MQNAPRREILAWSMYDFANSAFTTTVTAVVFQFWLIESLVPKEGARIWGATLAGPTVWSLCYAVSLTIAGAIAPIIGAICDNSAAKKKWMTAFWLVGCASTMSLFFVGPGAWLAAALLFIVANVCWESSVSLNSAFLPELAPPERLDRVSSIGWGIGYIGGFLCLLLNLQMVDQPHWFGIPADRAVNYAVASVGLWWLLFSLPCILFVKERARPRGTAAGSLILGGFRKVFSTMRNLRRLKTLAVLTTSVLIFLAAVYTVLAMATSFAQKALGFSQTSIILCFLMIQIVAAVGALAAALTANRLPTKTALIGMLFVWIGCLIWAFFMKTQAEFWVLGAIIGFVMGGTQALARGLQAQFTPPSSTGEFFGFYGVTQKLGAAGASYLYALASAGAWGVRGGILAILAVFVVGLVLLWPVKVAVGRQECRDEELRLQKLGAGA